ncbi:Mps one binder kinase activatorlike 4like [Caligus rogercresseyi]|uniref:Mps one binder kinase activatorlike 4like n=1 Tax=Caligus rogercresseyi TaxID=217165 RepID=A0A7T8QV96_CALRO|nr:Mps one binder kinase activatorlike 4like [Caligus rogercresseyi]
MATALLDASAPKPTLLRNNFPGTKSQDFNRWPSMDFEDMESTLAVQQIIQQRIREDVSDVEWILSPPDSQDEGVWKYEHLRQFSLELNGLAVGLQSDCSPKTCNQMTATQQWIFLCAAHKTPKDCSAIDYTRHTLDGAACLLNSNKYFPSRVSIKEGSISKLASVCRRVYRIFSHAYYHHRELFEAFETESHLCRRFTRYVMKYDLMPRDVLIIPIGDNQGASISESVQKEEDPEVTENTTAGDESEA